MRKMTLFFWSAPSLDAEERAHRSAGQCVAREAGLAYRTVQDDERWQSILRTLGSGERHLRIGDGTGAADRGERMAHEATVAVESGTQAPYRGIVGARIARAVDGRLLAEDRKRGEPEGGLVRREIRKLMTGAVSIRVHGLDRIDDPLVEDGALDGNALITDRSGARVDCPERFDRGGIRDLRDRWPGEERDHQQPKG
jgi:hypothetical protein